jgi:hypothetical protein
VCERERTCYMLDANLFPHEVGPKRQHSKKNEKVNKFNTCYSRLWVRKQITHVSANWSASHCEALRKTNTDAVQT